MNLVIKLIIRVFNCDDLLCIYILHVFLHSAVPTQHFYIHRFIYIFSAYITHEFNAQLPGGVLVHLIRGLHSYHSGRGSNPAKPSQLSFLYATASLTAMIVHAFIQNSFHFLTKP